jgi:hypothetical protein
MKQYFEGPRPDITPPQLTATIVAGIPILASLLSAFGLYDLTPAQQEAMSDAVTWAGVLGAALIGGDAALRTARNRRKATVEAVLAEGGEGESLEIVDRRVVPSKVATPDTRPPSEDETVVLTEEEGTTYQPSTGFEEEPKPPPPPPRRRRHK